MGIYDWILRVLARALSDHFFSSPKEQYLKESGETVVWEILCLFPVCVSEYSVFGEGETQLSKIK